MITKVNASSQKGAVRILKQDHDVGRGSGSVVIVDKIRTLRRYCKTPGKRCDGLYEITWHRILDKDWHNMMRKVKKGNKR
jgi:hypothetical protein